MARPLPSFPSGRASDRIIFPAAKIECGTTVSYPAEWPDQPSAVLQDPFPGRIGHDGAALAPRAQRGAPAVAGRLVKHAVAANRLEESFGVGLFGHFECVETGA